MSKVPRPDAPAARLAAFLARYRVAGVPLTRAEVQDAAERIGLLASASEAELTARGYRLLTVAHGVPETDEESGAVRQLHAWGDRHTGAVAGTHGGTDTTTWILTGARADEHAAALRAIAQEHNPGWWRIRPAGQPRPAHRPDDDERTSEDG